MQTAPDHPHPSLLCARPCAGHKGETERERGQVLPSAAEYEGASNQEIESDSLRQSGLCCRGTKRAYQGATPNAIQGRLPRRGDKGAEI